MKDVYAELAMLAVVLGACTLVPFVVACHEEQRAKNAIDLAGYQHALDACREKGKRAKDLDVYEACAKEADRAYGYDAGGSP